MVLLRNLSILWTMFHVLILFSMLYHSRYSRKKTIILTGVCMGVLMVFNMTSVIVLGTERTGQLLILICTIPSLLFFYHISKEKDGRFFFTFCLADTVAIWIIIVTNVIDFYLGGEQYILMFLGRLFLFPLVEYYAARYLRKPYRELQEAVPEGWGIFAAMTALYYVLLNVSAVFPKLITKRPQELPALLLVLVLMPFTYATVFSALYKQLLLYRRQQSDRTLQEQKLQLEVQLENQQRIRKMKHDMKAYTVVLSGLLASGKTEEAVEYLNNIKSEMEIIQGQFCGNIYLNAIFGHYFPKFQELGADLRLDIQIGDEELPYMELSQILSNGLENAYDALEGLDGKRGEASVQVKYSRDYLVIRMKNRCRDDLSVEKGMIPATDKKESGHGFGLRTIQEAAARLDGEMFCYTENGNFVLDVMVRVKN